MVIGKRMGENYVYRIMYGIPNRDRERDREKPYRQRKNLDHKQSKSFSMKIAEKDIQNDELKHIQSRSGFNTEEPQPQN